MPFSTPRIPFDGKTTTLRTAQPSPSRVPPDLKRDTHAPRAANNIPHLFTNAPLQLPLPPSTQSMTLNNAPFARTVTLASLVYLAVASSLFAPAFALAASGDPEAKADDSVAAASEGSSDVAAGGSSTAFIMGDVATLLGAKDMDEAGESSNDAGELVEPVPGESSKNDPGVFSFIFGEEPSRTTRVVETMFPMSWDVPLAPSTHVAFASMPRRSLRPCRHGREDPGRYADVFSLARAREGDEAPPWALPREGFGVTTWVVCVDVIALLVTVVALVIITVLAMLLLDLCPCCFGVRDDDDAAPRPAHTADAATETLLPRPEDGKQLAHKR